MVAGSSNTLYFCGGNDGDVGVFLGPVDVVGECDAPPSSSSSTTSTAAAAAQATKPTFTG